MTNMTAMSLRHNRDHIEREIERCRTTQSWAPHAIRSAWYPEVEAVLDAIDRGATEEEIASVAAVAFDRAVALAEKVVRERIIPDADRVLRDALDDAGIESADDLSLAELIGLCREHGVTVDQTDTADGILVNEHEASAFAVVRSIIGAADDNPDWVSVDLIAVEAK